jgi:NodT family efflux transporter outer membrane factor (OMF) lipoprotein
LIADVAAAYVDFQTFERRLELARQNVVVQEGSFRIAKAQFPEVTSELDLRQAEANLERTRALIPTLQIGRRQAQNRLCVLLGMPTHDLSQWLHGPPQIPRADPHVVVGVPADLLRRRPDVRRAERRVAAQSARIGIAVSDLLPRLTVAGSISIEAEDFSDLFTSASTGGFVGPSFNWKILNYGRIKNNIRFQDARLQRLAVNYQETVLRANQEAEDAIVAFLQSQQRVKHLAISTRAAVRSVELGRIQFREGSIDFGRVFILEQTLVEEQDRLARAQADIALSLIRLYKALGGGWQIRCEPPVIGESLERLPAAETITTPPATPADEASIRYPLENAVGRGN